MKKVLLLASAALGLAAAAVGFFSEAERVPTLAPVDMQLRWHHQFQFAGYYAALEKGFYREEGLDVTLHAGAPERQPVNEVLAGRAQYAEGNSEVLYRRLKGDPLVALAAIFQHSPSVLIARRDSGISTVHDLVGKRVMLMEGGNDADFLTMLRNEGVSPQQVQSIPSSFRLDDLIEGKVDAFNSYLTNEPFYLLQRGVDFNVIEPRNYRVDFYSDILFTTEAELRQHPERVAAFRRATLRGWRYAMEHPDEVIDLLLDKYHVEKSRAHLEFEASAMRPLILPELIEIGHMNPARFEHMAATMASAGMIGRDYSLEGFAFDDPPAALPLWARHALLAASAFIVLLVVGGGYALRVNRSLASARNSLHRNNEVLSQNLAEIRGLQQRLQEQALRDPVTGLYNRRYLDECLLRELARARREGYPISLALIDLDHFKRINDTHGHQAGDKVLQTLADLLKAGAREGDIACRFGGEEFVVLMPRLAQVHAEARMEQWRLAFAHARTAHGALAIEATMSIGLAIYPQHGSSAEELLDCADQALYRAKSEGRNRLVVAG